MGSMTNPLATYAAATVGESAADTGLRDRVADFLAREADLLDRGAYVEWAALYDNPCTYWVPVDPAAETPEQGMSHVYDDRQLLDARVHRLLNPRYNQPEPSPRTVHVVGSIRVAAPDDGGLVTATSSLLVAEYRYRGYGDGDKRLFAGKVLHRLVPDGDGFLIRLKRVDLYDSLGSFNAILVPL